MEGELSATGSLCVPVDDDGYFTLSDHHHHHHHQSTALVELKLLVAQSKTAAEAALRPLASLLRNKKVSFRTLLGDFDCVVNAARSLCSSKTLVQPVRTLSNQRRRGSVSLRSPGREALAGDRALLSDERKQLRVREVTVAELIVRCFLLGVPMELLQRLLQASILLQAREGRGCAAGTSVKRCEHDDGLAVLQFFYLRLQSVLASSSDHPQLSWLVERTIASAQRVARGGVFPDVERVAGSRTNSIKNPGQGPAFHEVVEEEEEEEEDEEEKERSPQSLAVCANPMCVQKIQGHRYSHPGKSTMRARRSAGRGLVQMDCLADPVFRDHTSDDARRNERRAASTGPGDDEHGGNNRRRTNTLRAKGRVCLKCATTSQAIFTTKQFPFGYKYCTSCRCFHELLHFIDHGQARARQEQQRYCGQANHESPANRRSNTGSTACVSDQTGPEQGEEEEEEEEEGAAGMGSGQASILSPGEDGTLTDCVRSTCHASRQFYHMVDGQPLTDTPPSVVQSVTSNKTHCATTIGPYSDPQHRHEDVQRFLHPSGQLWKRKPTAAALGSIPRPQCRNRSSSRTQQPSRSSRLAKKAVKRVLLSTSFLSANPDVVQAVDSSGQKALAALLEAKIARSIAAVVHDAEAQASLPHAEINTTNPANRRNVISAGSVGGDSKNDFISVVRAAGTPPQQTYSQLHQTGQSRKRSSAPQDSASGSDRSRHTEDAAHSLPSFLYRGNRAITSSVDELCEWAAERSHALRLKAMGTFFSQQFLQDRSDSVHAESSASRHPPRRRRRP